jgi:hypothetical protein
MAQQLKLEIGFDFHILVYPAPDVEGDWVAHSLELDMIAQGTSQDHALQMLHEAFETVVRYNADHGLVPIQIRFAPPEAWQAAGVARPESIEIKSTWRSTPEPSTRPIDLTSLAGLPSFKTIVADRAPAAP